MQATLFEVDQPRPAAATPQIVLRDYQRSAVDAVFEHWQTQRSTLVCLPTGCGKSVVFSEVMRRWMTRES